jgi:putative tryptophan/tyrosine transport system substrate-binding protein
MRRREFIGGLGSAVVWPLAAGAQQSAVPVVGFLHEVSPEGYEGLLAGFRQGLAETGFLEGRNLTVEYHWARRENATLPEIAADLVRRKVAVIATPSPSAALAAKAATTTIPVVFALAGDPVELGLVASFNRPSGNITGLYDTNASLLGKELELLSQFKLNVGPFAMLTNPTSPYSERMVTDLQAAGAALGRDVQILNAATNREIDAAFAVLQNKPAAALIVAPSQLFFVSRVQIVTLATRHALPVLSSFREFAEIGGLMSYGSSPTERNRQAGQYVGRILKGENPANLPVVQASKYEFVINLKTANALGLTIPETLLATADEVIQ